MKTEGEIDAIELNRYMNSFMDVTDADVNWKHIYEPRFPTDSLTPYSQSGA